MGTVKVNLDEMLDQTRTGLPDGIKLWDIGVNPNGCALFFLATPWGRTTIAVTGGDNQIPRFFSLLGDFIMAKNGKKLDACDKKELKEMGAKKFIAHEKADIKAAKSAPKKGKK